MSEKKIDDGGPAYPHFQIDEDGTGYVIKGGMTLRDYFAGQALAAIIAHTELCDDEGNWNAGPAKGMSGITNMACFSYAAADEMLAVRKEATP